MLVEILYELGAVPFVRTNVPQTLMVRSTPNSRQLHAVDLRDLALTVGRDAQPRLRQDHEPVQPLHDPWRLKWWRRRPRSHARQPSWRGHRHWRVRQSTSFEYIDELKHVTGNG